MRSDRRSDLERFIENEYPRLSNVLTLYCGDRDLGEELAQEALVRTCRDWRKVAKADSPSAWVTRVGLNLANSVFRRRKIERRVLRDIVDTVDPVHNADAAEVISVRQAVVKLPPRQRKALLLRYYLDLSVSETARVMECPEGTVKTLTRSAIAGLRHDINIGEHDGIPDVV